MGKRVPFLFLSISLAGFLLVYWLWPKHDQLPVLDQVSSFELAEAHGTVYELNNGKVKLVTFFYTNCPDICPLTMMDFKQLQTTLKQERLFGEKVELVAISLDPEQDTLPAIQKYAHSFQADPAGWKWLRGTPSETKQIAKQLQMQYEKIAGDFFSHSTTMYLIDQENRIRALYDMAYSSKPIEKEKILQDMYYLIEGS